MCYDIDRDKCYRHSKSTLSLLWDHEVTLGVGRILFIVWQISRNRVESVLLIVRTDRQWMLWKNKNLISSGKELTVERNSLIHVMKF